jgi:hypothetical protein
MHMMKPQLYIDEISCKENVPQHIFLPIQFCLMYDLTSYLKSKYGLCLKSSYNINCA